MGNKQAHLEMIQGVINRMGGNSFLLKGWAVTLLAGLLALDISKPEDGCARIAYLPIILFWVLDSYFLYQERSFRKLYDAVRVKDEAHVDFSMRRGSSFRLFLEALFSKTLSLFYGILLIATTYILTKRGF